MILTSKAKTAGTILILLSLFWVSTLASPVQAQATRIWNDRLGCSLVAPEGWEIQSSEDAVSFVSPSQDAVITLKAVKTDEEKPLSALLALYEEAAFSTYETFRKISSQDSTMGGVPAISAVYQIPEVYGTDLKREIIICQEGEFYYALNLIAPESSFEGYQGHLEFVRQNFSFSDGEWEITTLIAEDRIVAPGATVQVPIRLEKAEDIGSLGFNLDYDPAVARLTKVLKGSLLAPATFVYNMESPGVVRFGFATAEAISGEKGSAAYVEFEAIGGEGSKSALTLSDILATDASGVTLSVDLVDGELTIGGRTGGDGDGDGEIGVLDALIALKMYVKLIAEDLNLDMNEDGQVTPEDARRILETAKPG